MNPGKYYILNQSFETIYFIDRYESILWVDRYDTAGEFEVVTIPTAEVIEFAVVDNYVWSSISKHLMIIEKVEITTSVDNGARYRFSGRSLESILDRRVLLYKTYFNANVEDDVRQIVEWAFVRSEDEGRNIDNLIFEYSEDPAISEVEDSHQFEAGDDLLSVISEMLKVSDLGFEMTLNDSNQFVLRLIHGVDRSYEQEDNPWIIFSPKFNNLITDRFYTDAGPSYRNYLYIKNNDIEIIKGESTGLNRRERIENGNISKEIEQPDGTTKTLTDEEYRKAINTFGDTSLKEASIETVIESEVEPKIGNIYGEDYFIGDIVQVENELGFTGRVRVTEFIVQHDTSGIQMYPTFTSVVKEDSE